MDMLYTRYHSPMDLVGRYIKQRRFGTFCYEFIKADYERKQEKENKESEWMAWFAYIHSDGNESFDDWKRRIMKTGQTKARKNKDQNLTDEGIQSIMGRLFPSQTSPGK